MAGQIEARRDKLDVSAPLSQFVCLGVIIRFLIVAFAIKTGKFLHACAI